MNVSELCATCDIDGKGRPGSEAVSRSNIDSNRANYGANTLTLNTTGSRELDRANGI